MRDPTSPERFWIKGAGLGLSEVGPEDMVLMDLDGKVVAGTRPHHFEYHIHSEIFRRRPEINSVIHTHPFYATIVASLDAPLLPGIGWSYLVGNKPVPRFLKTALFIATPALGQEMAEVMGDHSILLLRNHGVVLAAQSLERATAMAVRLERTCHAQLLAMATAAPVYATSDEELMGREGQASQNAPQNPRWLWEYFVRQAPKQPSP